MTRMIDRLRRIIPIIAILLLPLTVYAVFFESGQDTANYSEVSITDNDNWNTYRNDVRHQESAPPMLHKLLRRGALMEDQEAELEGVRRIKILPGGGR